MANFYFTLIDNSHPTYTHPHLLLGWGGSALTPLGRTGHHPVGQGHPHGRQQNVV